MKEKKKLNAGEVAQIFEISENTVKKLAKAGDLPCKYINRRPLFCTDELKRHFERLEGGAA